MDKEVYQIRDTSILAKVVQRLKDLPLLSDKPFQVIITQGDDLRTLLQNNLYWKHIGEISKASGDLRNDVHYGLKRRHLHPLYMADDTAKNIEYQANYAALCTIKESGVNIDFEILHNKILSTTDATPKQMGEYISSYWVEINQRGIYITDPDSFMRGEV